MNESVFEIVEKSSQILKLDFSSIEFAKLAEEQEMTEAQIQAVGMVFEHLQKKKIETTIHTLLKMSRLPLKDPKTFENFDFSDIKGRDATKLKTLPSLSAIYAHRNLAFIGPAGTGKTHLAQAFGYECCQRGITFTILWRANEIFCKRTHTHSTYTNKKITIVIIKKTVFHIKSYL